MAPIARIIQLRNTCLF